MSVLRIVSKGLINATRRATITKNIAYSSRPTNYMQKRLKTYIVGIDGSKYGYCALQSTANTVSPKDNIIAMHFLPNFEV